MTAREIDLDKFNPPVLSKEETLKRLREQLSALPDTEVIMRGWVEHQIAKLEKP